LNDEGRVELRLLAYTLLSDLGQPEKINVNRLLLMKKSLYFIIATFLVVFFIATNALAVPSGSEWTWAYEPDDDDASPTEI
jgi:hypothetical protein